MVLAISGVFRSKYKLIRKCYNGQTRFFLLDKDLDDSSEIGTLIKQGKDIVQFIEYNSEYLLLKLADKNPRNPADFNDMGCFRDYCKSEFAKQFKKNASDFKDVDFDLVFSNVGDEEIRSIFAELFSTLS